MGMGGWALGPAFPYRGAGRGTAPANVARRRPGACWRQLETSLSRPLLFDSTATVPGKLGEIGVLRNAGREITLQIVQIDSVSISGPDTVLPRWRWVRWWAFTGLGVRIETSSPAIPGGQA